MGTLPLTLVLLLVGCFSLATHLVPRQQEWHGGGGAGEAEGLLSAVMGDSRRLVAGWIYTRADIYFHSGYYASVFDLAGAAKTGGAKGKGADHSKCRHEQGRCAHSHSGCNHDHGRPLREDWIARFSRNFYPSEHTHLGKNGDEREILPWLRLAAEFDPQRVETYTVAAFWLRDRLGRMPEAEQFLREGLRANPGHHALLFELGRCYGDGQRDPVRARNLWELAFNQWLKTEGNKSQPDLFAYSQIVAQLAGLEERTGDLEKSIRYLRLLKKASPHPESIETRIQELTRRLPVGEASTGGPG